MSRGGMNIHITIWQSDNKWTFDIYVSKEYDYNPWLDIVSWILEEFQILEVLFKRISNTRSIIENDCIHV